MSCKDALAEKVPPVTPDQTVETVIKSMRNSGVSIIPVVDADNALVGVFSFGILLEDTMPVSLAVGGGGGEDAPPPMNVRIPAAPGMVKRLKRSMMSPVSALMQRPRNVVHPDTPLESAIREIREAGGPVPVVEPKTNEFVGFVSDESLLDALEKKA
jgi:CBS domain-containing protein